jgi:hypothetical protein
MQFSFRLRTREYERFAPGCFDGQIGNDWPLRLPSGDLIPARLLAATVAPDGSSVDLTVEAEGGFELVVPGAAPDWFAWRNEWGDDW